MVFNFKIISHPFDDTGITAVIYRHPVRYFVIKDFCYTGSGCKNIIAIIQHIISSYIINRFLVYEFMEF